METANRRTIGVRGAAWEDEEWRRDLERTLAADGWKVTQVNEDRAGDGEYDLELERL